MKIQTIWETTKRERYQLIAKHDKEERWGKTEKGKEGGIERGWGERDEECKEGRRRRINKKQT